jgi:hypothetical protein
VAIGCDVPEGEERHDSALRIMNDSWRFDICRCLLWVNLSTVVRPSAPDSLVETLADYLSSLDADERTKFRAAVNARVTPIAAPQAG